MRECRKNIVPKLAKIHEIEIRPMQINKNDKLSNPPPPHDL
jgi:hypothetical protein